MAVKNKRPRLLIEDWLPAAAIGVECMRERGSASALAPHTYLHVWWARRPLVASRAAVLGSLLPAEFPREQFERLLGFGLPGQELVEIRRMIDGEIADTREKKEFGCERAFSRPVAQHDLELMQKAVKATWQSDVTVVDPMAGGGSIPLESARMGFRTLANEYNPVACSILEATLDYPFRFGPELTTKSKKWGRELHEQFLKRVGHLFPKTVAGGHFRPDGYLFARTVPCPDTGFDTPLVPDWHLTKSKGDGRRVAAVPVVNEKNGTWRVQIKEIGKGASQINVAPPPTYNNGKGISLFGDRRQISPEYIKTMAQQDRMKSALYAVVIRMPQGLTFAAPELADLEALVVAEKELNRCRSVWERNNIIPTELYPEISSDERPRTYGMPRWADMFSPRQLFCFGVLVEELNQLRPAIIKAEGPKTSEAIIHLLAFAIDKYANYNSVLASWHAPRQVIRSVFDRHDFSFKTTFTELASCNDGMGVSWAIANSLEPARKLAELPKINGTPPVLFSIGSATSLPTIEDETITAVIVDPPYSDNVQYSELANFFYVWLKRTQGYRRPEWFSTYLCEHDHEAVVNAARHRKDGEPLKIAKTKANEYYQRLMNETFSECNRILRDDGVLTVMFTHKKQEAWEALFSSLIEAGFTITATWPIKTESEHSLHQAKKNAAQSTVILVARKRFENAGVGYFDAHMQEEIRQAARKSAERLKNEGLNAVDQLVGSFGPAIEVFSRYDEVRTDIGEKVSVSKAIDEASDAVTKWRIEQLAAKGLDGVEAEGQFYLLCWDVLGAAEFRYNEAHLLGKAVGMDIDALATAGLLVKSGENIKMLPAKERRRQRALEPDEIEQLLFGTVVREKRRTKKDALKVHPNDPQFRTALDACHALALRYIEAKGSSGGIGSAKALVRQQGWNSQSAVAKLMAALVNAAPDAVKFEKGKTSAAAIFPEFRAWHELLPELFGIKSPEWKEKQVPQGLLAFSDAEQEEDDDVDGGETDSEEENQ